VGTFLCPRGFSKFKTNTVGGSPTPSHFLLLRQKESDPRKGDPGLPPFGFPRYFANKRGCATRPSEAHKTCLTAELKQCSPKPPLAGEIPRRRSWEENAKPQIQNPASRACPIRHNQKNTCAQRTQNRLTAFYFPSPVHRRVAQAGQGISARTV
jgi:hypothetical protein